MKVKSGEEEAHICELQSGNHIRKKCICIYIGQSDNGAQEEKKTLHSFYNIVNGYLSSVRSVPQTDTYFTFQIVFHKN